MKPDRSRLPPKPPKKPGLTPVNETNGLQTNFQSNSNQSTQNFDQQIDQFGGIGSDQPTWDQFFDEIKQVEIQDCGKFQIYCAGNSGPLILCIHGGGYTGLTWALLAKELKQQCRVFAPDLRGHGCSQTSNDLDLSKETISKDIIQIFNSLFDVDPLPPVVLVGHSMGGAMAVWAAQLQNSIPSLQGVVVLDVVEGTALASLVHMTAILDKRPQQFSSIQKAIKWALTSGQYKNALSAQLQIPSQLIQQQAGEEIIYVWRTDLYHSSKFWRGWYEGLSEAFLDLKVPKILILAGTDRLDKTLIIGQMQGKFQQVMLPSAGHAVHEDEAEKVAEVLLKFLIRYKLVNKTE
eukprot:TRINITY_DN21907_c0_g1_i1.p1 TRINITY_DN21907_c0_g1~~TRINITY_DN21907_c0_g1_i1.p1  ORF type:complete len:382 (+),score=49.69 TRINITY_DN21907_c0_g1_i1:102-1148(+)